MTRDDIIRIAREADIIDFRDADDDPHTAQMVQFLERFAELAVAAEREACAKVCEDGVNNATDWDSSAWDQACENRAYAIRARKDQDAPDLRPKDTYTLNCPAGIVSGQQPPTLNRVDAP